MARAFVTSTEVRAGPPSQRRLLQRVHLDSGRGSAARVFAGEQLADPPPIVVKAEVAGLPPATVSIPLTLALDALPLAVASASAAATAVQAVQASAKLG